MHSSGTLCRMGHVTIGNIVIQWHAESVPALCTLATVTPELRLIIGA